MVSIEVRFFASLRERVGRGGVRLSVPAGTTVAQVWSHAAPGQEMPANVLMARNMEYTQGTEAVTEGDEVAFFPPVTGGAPCAWK